MKSNSPIKSNSVIVVLLPPNTNIKNYNKKVEADALRDKYISLKAQINNMAGTAKAVPSYNFHTNESVSERINIKKIKQEAENLKSFIKSPFKAGEERYVYGWDTETLGSAVDEATEFEKQLFGVTELSLVRNKILPDGTIDYKHTETIKNIKFGVPSEKKGVFSTLLEKAKNSDWGTLTSAEQSTIHRLGMYSELPKEFIKGTHDLRAAEMGLNKLIAKGVKGQSYNSKYSALELDKFFNKIEELNDIDKDDKNPIGNPIMGFNSESYDNKIIKFLRDNNINNMDNKNPFFIKNHVDVYEMSKLVEDGDSYDYHHTLAEGERELYPYRLNTLESFANSINEPLDAHIGTEDSRVTIKLGTMELPGFKETMYNQAINKIASLNKGPELNATTFNDIVLHANKALPIGPLDYVQAENGTMKTWMTWGLKRNHFYKVESYKILPVELLSGEAKEAFKSTGYKINPDTKNLYIMKLADAYSGKDINKASVTLVRESEEEITAILQNHTLIHTLASSVNGNDTKKVTQAMIDQATKNAVRDNVRRNWDAMFDSNVEDKGYKYAKEMYTLYGNIKGSSNESDLTKEKALSIALDFRDKAKDSKTSVYKNFENLSDEKIETFTELFDILKDTDDFMKPIFENIDENFKSLHKEVSHSEEEYIASQKTLALSNVHEAIIKKISEVNHNQLTEDSIKNMFIREPSVTDMGSIDIWDSITESYFKVNGNSKGEIISGLNKKVNLIDKELIDSSTRDATRMEYIKETVKDLMERGLLEEEFYEKHLRDAYNPSEALKTIATHLHTNITNATFKYTESDLLNYGFMTDTVFGKSPDDIAKDEVMLKFRKTKITPIKEFDTTGYKITDKIGEDSYVTKTLSKYVLDENNMNLSNITYENMYKSKPSFYIEGFSTNLEPEKSLPDALIDHLHDNLHWSDNNIETLSKTLFMRTKDKGIGLNTEDVGSNIAFFETRYEDGTTKTFMSTHLDKDREGVLNDIKNNIAPRRSINIELVGLDNTHGIKSVQIGKTSKLVTQRLNVYVANDKGDAINRLRVEQQDIIDRTISAVKKNYSIIKSYLSEGKFESGERHIERAITEEIQDVTGPSLYQTISKQELNKEEFEFATGDLPNLNTVRASKLVDVGSTINFVPFLYRNAKEGDKIKEDINKILEINGIKNEDFVSGWEEALASKNIKTLQDMNQPFQEWFLSNFTLGRNILGAIIDNYNFKDNNFVDSENNKISKSKETLEYIRDSHPSSLIREKKAAAGYVGLGNDLEDTAYGFINSITRPPMNQKDSFHVIEANNISDKTKELFEKRNMKIGEVYGTKSYYDNYVKAYEKEGFESGITTDIKILTTEQVNKAYKVINAEDLLNKLNEKRIELTPEQFIDPAYADSIMNMKYTKADFDNIMKKMLFVQDVSKGHTIINPFLVKHLYKDFDLMRIKLEESFESLKDENGNNIYNVGSYVEKDAVIGTYTSNGKRTEKRSKHRGMISSIEGNSSIYLSPVKGTVGIIKTNDFGAEKSVSSFVDWTRQLKDKEGEDILGARDDFFYDLTQEIFDQAFGENIGKVGLFEIGKHETGSVFMTRFNVLAEQASKLDNASTNKARSHEAEFIRNVNQTSLSTLMPEFDTDKTTGNRIFKISGNPEKANYFEGLNKLWDMYKNKDDYSKVIERYDTTGKEVGVSDGIIIRSVSRKTKLTEFNITKGGKIGQRNLQLLGAQFGKDPEDFRKYDDETKKWVKRSDKIKASKIKQIKSTKEYKNAMVDVANINAAINLNLGKPEEEVNAKIREVNLSTINISKSGLTEEQFINTVLSTASDGEYPTNVLKINFPDGMVIKSVSSYNTRDEKTGKLVESYVDHVYIPISSPHNVDGELFFSDSTKTSMSFLSALSAMSDSKTLYHKSLPEFESYVNDKYLDLFQSFNKDISYDKHGLLQQAMVSGRLKFSSHYTAGSSTSATVSKTGEFFNEELAKDVIAHDEKGNLLLRDIAMTSHQAIKDMGINYEQVGRQLIKENFQLKDLDPSKEYDKYFYEKTIELKSNLQKADALDEHGRRNLQLFAVQSDEELQAEYLSKAVKMPGEVKWSDIHPASKDFDPNMPEDIGMNVSHTSRVEHEPYMKYEPKSVKKVPNVEKPNMLEIYTNKPQRSEWVKLDRNKRKGVHYDLSSMPPYPPDIIIPEKPLPPTKPIEPIRPIRDNSLPRPSLTTKKIYVENKIKNLKRTPSENKLKQITEKAMTEYDARKTEFEENYDKEYKAYTDDKIRGKEKFHSELKQYENKVIDYHTNALQDYKDSMIDYQSELYEHSMKMKGIPKQIEARDELLKPIRKTYQQIIIDTNKAKDTEIYNKEITKWLNTNNRIYNKKLSKAQGKVNNVIIENEPNVKYNSDHYDEVMKHNTKTSSNNRMIDTYNEASVDVHNEKVDAYNKAKKEDRIKFQEAKKRENQYRPSLVENITDYNDDLKNSLFEKREKIKEANTKLEKKYYESIGKAYSETVGFIGENNRSPIIMTTSQRFVILKGTDSITGNTVHTQSFTAQAKKEDYDGDSVGIGIVAKDYKEFLHNPKFELTEETKKQIYYQSKNNPKLLLDALNEELGLPKDKELEELPWNVVSFDQYHYAANDKNYMEKLKDIYGPDSKMEDKLNYFREESQMIQAVKARHNKIGVGTISGANFKLKEIADTVLNTSVEDLSKNEIIHDFAYKVEQKIIDPKHIKLDSKAIDKIQSDLPTFFVEKKQLATEAYRNALKLMSTGDVSTSEWQPVSKVMLGTRKLMDSLNMAGFYDEETPMPLMEDVLSGKADDKFSKGVKEIHDLFTGNHKELANKIYNSTVFNNDSIKIVKYKNPTKYSIDKGEKTQERFVNETLALANGNLNYHSELIDDVQNIMKEANDVKVIKIKKSLIEDDTTVATKILDTVNGSDKEIIPLGVYKAKGTHRGEVSGALYLQLDNNASGSSERIYGTNYADISRKMNTYFDTVDTSKSNEKLNEVNSSLDKEINKRTENEIKAYREKELSEAFKSPEALHSKILQTKVAERYNDLKNLFDEAGESEDYVKTVMESNLKDKMLLLQKDSNGEYESRDVDYKTPIGMEEGVVSSVLEDNGIVSAELKNHLYKKPFENINDDVNISPSYLINAPKELDSHVVNFSKTIKVLTDEKLLKKEEGIDMLREFNDRIRTDALIRRNAGNIDFDITDTNNIEKVRNEYIEKALSKNTNVSPAPKVEDIINKSNAMTLDYSNLKSTVTPIPNDNVDNIKNDISNIKTYNINEIEHNLHSNLENKNAELDMDKINIPSSPKVSNEEASRFSLQSLVLNPLSDYKKLNKESLEKLSLLHSQLAVDNSQSAMKALQWESLEENRKLVADGSYSSLRTIGNQKISFGKLAGMEINQVSILDLKEIFESDKVKNPIEMKSQELTKSRIGSYFSILDNETKDEDVSDFKKRVMDIETVKRGESDITNNSSVTKDINEAIREEAKQSEERAINKAREEALRLEQASIRPTEEAIVKDGFHMTKTKALIAGGVALGLAGILTAQHTAAPSALRPDRQSNGSGSPDVNGNYDSNGVRVTPRVAPSTPNVRVTELGSGVHYKVRASSDKHTDTNSITGGVHKILNQHTGTNLRVNVNTQNDNSKVSDNWLKSKINNLL